MSVRRVRELARVVIIGMLAVSPGMAAATDLTPQPSAIAEASISKASISEASISMAAIAQEPEIGLADFPPAARSQEPFGGLVTRLPQGALLEKWNVAKNELRIDIDIIAACRSGLDRCETPAAKHIIAIIEEARKRQGRALIGAINRAINLAIAPVSDKIQYGVEDRWASPLTTFTSGRGDCEDYALAKYAALRAAGFVEDDLRLLIVRLPQSQTDHAVLLVRHEGHWLVLDNRRLAMLDVAYLDAVPLLALRESDVRPYLAADREHKMQEPLSLAYGGSAAGNAPNLM